MKNNNTELSDPYLIQRLKKPYKIKGVPDNIFAFGCGLMNGGLSKDALKLINDIWRYDYMGSAEFEFGAIPESLHAIGELRVKDKLTAFEMNVTATISDYRNNDVKSKEATVYVLCNIDHVIEIKDYIKILATHDKGFRTKESVNFKENIFSKEYYLDTVGWHDLDNNYMFFTDKEMFDKICIIFGLKK